jgi:hypothetical protein
MICEVGTVMELLGKLDLSVTVHVCVPLPPPQVMGIGTWEFTSAALFLLEGTEGRNWS